PVPALGESGRCERGRRGRPGPLRGPERLGDGDRVRLVQPAPGHGGQDDARSVVPLDVRRLVAGRGGPGRGGPPGGSGTAPGAGPGAIWWWLTPILGRSFGRDPRARLRALKEAGERRRSPSEGSPGASG